MKTEVSSRLVYKEEMAGYAQGTSVIMGPVVCIIKLLLDLALNKIMLKKVY